VDKFFRILIFTALFLALAQSAGASFVFTGLTSDMNAWDANGARHANAGEDFNVIIPNTNTRADVNSDHNYLVTLSYRGTYINLDVNALPITWNSTTRKGDASIGANNVVDANVQTVTLTGGGTPCAGTDANIIVLRKNFADLNTFNVRVKIPTTGAITALKGKEVRIELWSVDVSTATGNIAACVAKVADANFIIGPAILLRPLAAGSGSPGIGGVDTNLTILGYGWAPDQNVMIRYADANGITTADLNVTDVNYGMRAGNPYAQGNADRNVLGDKVFTNIADGIAASGRVYDYSGVKVLPDRNGNFDVNVRIPPVASTSLAGPGGAPDNNIIASNNVDQNASASIVITPGITMDTDQNVTVGICAYLTLTQNDTDANCSAVGGAFSRVSVETAMKNNYLQNMQRVKSFQVQMCDGVCSSGAAVLVQIDFNSDMNMSKGPQRNYSRDMNAARGKASMDTDQMPEFAMDANITMYNIKAPSSQMPILARDGKVCPAYMCKNRDKSTLSEGYVDAATGVSTWVYNAAKGDGNLSFRVSTFSTYETGTLSVELLTPAAGAKIRTPRNGVDANYTISFQFKDTNTLDSNIGVSPMQAIIYYSDYNGARTGAIIDDRNLFDNQFIRCNNYDVITADTNLAGWRTCYFDMNRADLNKIIGEYVIDVNIMAPFGRDSGQTNRAVIGYTDGNVFFNPPLIEITDANFNANAHYVITDYRTIDINSVIDFNIYLPDANADRNFTLRDYNLHFYLGSTPGSLNNDLNYSGGAIRFDQNFARSGSGSEWTIQALPTTAGLGFFVQCSEPPRTEQYRDYNCVAQFDTNWTFEGKYYVIAKIVNNTTRTVGQPTNPAPDSSRWFSHTIDKNELWDINSSVYPITINDTNAPTATTPDTNVATTDSSSSTNYTFALTCSDYASGANKYFWMDKDGTLFGNSATSSYMFNVTGTKTFWGWCTDYADNNSLRQSVTVTYSQQQGGTPVPPTETPPSSSPGGSPTVTPGTETTLQMTVSTQPTATEISETIAAAGLGGGAADEAAAAMEKAEGARAVTVEKTTDASGTISYQSTLKLTVSNKTDKKLKNVKVIEEIPKSVAASASQVSSATAFTVLKEDPIIQFVIESIMPNASAEVSYRVNSQITAGTAGAWTAPIVASLSEAPVCEGVTCAARECKTGTCNSATGACGYSNSADGTACGTDKECKAGTCVAKAAPPAITPPPAAAPDYTMLIAAIIVVLAVIAGGGYYYSSKGKKKGIPGIKK